MIHFLNYIAEYSKLTDDEIIQRSSSDYGINAQEALESMCERDFCKSIYNNLMEKFKSMV